MCPDNHGSSCVDGFVKIFYSFVTPPYLVSTQNHSNDKGKIVASVSLTTKEREEIGIDLCKVRMNPEDYGIFSTIFFISVSLKAFNVVVRM